ncbi:MAG: hypothetical protein ACXADY_03415 [Candidatus Hodarchaeales archaeon]
MSLLLILFLLFVYSGVFSSVTIAIPQSPIIATTVSETFDLRISQIVSEVESTFQRKVVLSRAWDLLILNVSVQNFGDRLDNVFLNVKTNGVSTQSTFSTFEEVGLIQAFCYQFEMPQSLILTLNNTKQTEIQLELVVLLDPGVSLRGPNLNFSVQKAQLIALDLIQPVERENLPLFSANHQFQIQPVKFSFQQKNLLASPLLLVQVPPGMRLACTVSVTLQGTGINYLMVEEQTFSTSGRSHSISFNLTITETSENQGIPIEVLVAPDYEGLSGLTRLFLSFTIFAVLEKLPSSPFVHELGAHPIPGWLMLPILLISLFGVPYYLVYQEHLVNRDETIIDPKKLTKL